MKKLYLLLASLPVFVTACAQGGKDIPNKTLGDSVFTKGDVIRIPAVLYDLGKATLRPESHVSLDHVVLFMQKHPGLVLEVQNHFDTRVNPNSSIRLTQVRAQSCLEYLVSQGIPKDRLIAKGYHCYQPIVTDIEIGKLKTVEEKEAAHQKNRRTQLKILRMDYAHTGASKSSRPKPDSISGKKVQVIIPVPDTAYYKYGFKVFTDTADWRLWESAVIKPIFSNAGARGPKDDARLDTIAAYLKNHPGLVIEIGSHIDSRGSDVFNLKLSTARAQSVASYLINKGAAPKQLIAKGYGETRLLIADSEINKLKTIVEKERAHGINRRIEITVRRPDFGKDVTILFPVGDCTYYAHGYCDVADTSTVWRLGLIKIKYQLGKAGILPESYPELDKLAEYMKRHPSFVIQVGSHSDARWSDAFSDRLHTRRSQNCVDYLVAKGIERERLEARGYYDKDPVIPDSEINAMTDINKKEAAHQLNRRTEIRLIRTDFKPAN